MNNKSKFKKSLKYGAIMTVVGLVMMLIPLDSVFATGTPTPDEEGTGWVKFENNNDVTWTAESGCIITGVEIHAGWSTNTSGIIGNGNYGHIARYELKDGSPTGNPIIYDFPNGLYVPDSTSIPENENPTNYTDWAYYGDYKVSGVGTQTARVYWDLASGSEESIVHQISWIKFYYTCDQSPVGQITVHKSIDALVDGSTVFYFELYQGTTLLETKSITGAGSATFDAKLAAGTYTVKETNTGFVTSVSLDGTNFTAGSSINADITGAVGSENTVEVWFKNIEEPECPTCSIEEVKPVCENDGVVFSLDATIYPGGYSNYDLLWSDGVVEGTFSNPTDADTTWTPPADFTGTATLTLTVTAGDCEEKICTVEVTVYPKPICLIASVDPICAGESVQLYAAVNGGTPGYTYSWDDDTVAGGTFNPLNSVEDPTWTPPSGFTGIATLTLTVTDSNECTTTCSVKVTVDPCEKKCKCSLVVLKRDGAGNAIDGAVFEVDGVRKTIKGGEARWDNLECNTTYEVKEISPEKITRRVTLGDCGERSTMRVVNEGEGEEYLVVAGIMEVLPFTGPAIPYSPFIGISTVLAGTFLYILSKPKKKR
ncbi:MAG: hypothetical protein WBA71_04810 [Candidatus Humimicrobiia bacterium]